MPHPNSGRRSAPRTASTARSWSSSATSSATPFSSTSGRRSATSSPFATSSSIGCRRRSSSGWSPSVFAILIGIPLGVLAGMKPRRGVDGGARGLALLGQTIPDFWLALVLILVFAVKLDWFPPFGRETFQLGAARRSPTSRSCCRRSRSALFPMAQLLRFTRSSVLEIVGEDYVRIARSKGIPSRLIYRRHILKNAMIPLISILSLQVGALLSGSLYIEAVFSWPGAGGLLAEAVGNRDFPLVQGLAFLGGLITIVFSLLADVLYQLADPRIRLGARSDDRRSRRGRTVRRRAPRAVRWPSCARCCARRAACSVRASSCC